MAKIGFVSLGCSKNQVDTEVMLHKLLRAGYEITPEETEADIVIINTCAFIESAKQESIDNIIDIAYLKEHFHLKGIVVTGCLAERYREQIMQEMPEVDAVLGIGSRDAIVDAVKRVEAGEKYQSFEDKEICELGGDRVLTTPFYTAYLKIAEGCDNRCTYCAIPLIRGKFRSRPMEELISEAKDLEKLGVKELCVIAQDTSRYGLDLYGKYSLDVLLRRITEETSIPWIRVLYCYPDKMTDALIEEMKNNPRILKYFDLPIQHISDKILTSMNRHGDSKLIKEVIAKIRREIPEATLRTTAIVGFPGESEEDFNELCEFVKETKFERFGAFTYSQEEDTPAAQFDSQIDEQTKQDRYDIIMAEQLRVSAEYCRARIGEELIVLCEDYDPVSSAYFGRGEGDAPDIDGKIYFRSTEKIEPGSFVRVRITEACDYDLIGEIVK
jgi:ribosomal protein S12 methylthiotransferase